MTVCRGLSRSFEKVGREACFLITPTMRCRSDTSRWMETGKPWKLFHVGRLVETKQLSPYFMRGKVGML